MRFTFSTMSVAEQHVQISDQTQHSVPPPNPAPDLPARLMSLKLEHSAQNLPANNHHQKPRSPLLRVKDNGCANGNSLNKSSNAKLITADELAERMSQPNVFLLLDCRPFLHYNKHHVIGALNMTCSDRFSRRRLEGGKCRVSDLVCGAEGKAMFSEQLSSDVILYDESSSAIAQLPSSSPVISVSNALSKEGRNHCILIGGIKSFGEAFPSLCMTPQDAPTPERLYSPTTPVMEKQIIDAPVGKVLPYLFIGNAHDAANKDVLQRLGVTHIINATSNVPLYWQKPEHPPPTHTNTTHTPTGSDAAGVNSGCDEVDGSLLVGAAPTTQTNRDAAPTPPTRTGGGGGGWYVKYCHLSATDTAQQDLAQYFDKVYNFIEEAKAANGRVLVHCMAGVSRSATLCISYLMRKSSMSMLDAYKYVKSKRSIIAPNFNFMGQLLEFEQKIKNGKVKRGEGDVNLSATEPDLK